MKKIKISPLLKLNAGANHPKLFWIFSLSDYPVALQCLSALNDSMIQVLKGLISVLIFFLQFSSTPCQDTPVVYENECYTLVVKVHS